MSSKVSGLTYHSATVMPDFNDPRIDRFHSRYSEINILVTSFGTSSTLNQVSFLFLLLKFENTLGLNSTTDWTRMVCKNEFLHHKRNHNHGSVYLLIDYRYSILSSIWDQQCSFLCRLVSKTKKTLGDPCGTTNFQVVIRILERQQVSVKATFHSGKLSVDWNGQENFSLSCELWVETNDFNTKKKNSCPFQSTDNFPEWKLAFTEQQMVANELSLSIYITA